MEPSNARKVFFAVGWLSLLLCTAAWSIPALDRSWTATQPDGSTIEIRKFGNEHFNYTGTNDGYPIRKDHKGFFRYIDENGNLTEIQATRDHAKDSEKNFRKKHPTDYIRHSLQQNSTFMGAPSTDGEVTTDEPLPSQLPAINNNVRTGEKRALVILVQFKDTKFFSEDPRRDFDRMLNEEGYNDDNNIGSARDYFIQNSLGLFQPVFDVVGPITISGNNYKTYGQLSANKDYGAQIALKEAIDTLIKHGEVDFSLYDNNKDRYVDFVHMIYAGYGSHDSDQDSAIWPHKWIFTERKRVGSRLYVDYYACSAERDGYSFSKRGISTKYAGVGNFLHEFSHLMGLPDLYARNDSTIITPGSWSIMDAGAYNTNNPTGPLGTVPPYYSAFERLSLGWINVNDLNTNGSAYMTSIDKNVALRLQNPKNRNEFFLMEYRSNSKWDSGLPNHGMLIWHIDYKQSAWDSAKVNTAERQHIYLVRADGITSKNSFPGDAFPGRDRVKSFDQFVLWDGTDLQVALSDITESRDRTYVKFNIAMDAPDGDIELLEGTEIDVPMSSEEFDDEESSSSESVIESSDSEESSDSVESSSSEEVQFVYNTESAKGIKGVNLYVTRERSRMTITGLPEKATVYLFSINGQLLYRNTFTGGTAEIDTRKYAGPILVKVLSIFRE